PTSMRVGGLVKMVVDPTTGLYWFVSQGTNVLHGWMLNAAGAPVVDQTSLPGGRQPMSIDFDDQGHMYVSHSQGVTELFKSPAAGWMVVPDSPFSDAPPGVAFTLTS